MLRKIIKIDEDKCTGCGLCAEACHEGAIVMENGKAKLAREDYCDGLGDCLPACPTGAIRFEEREAPAYDAAAVANSKAAKSAEPLPCARARTAARSTGSRKRRKNAPAARTARPGAASRSGPCRYASRPSTRRTSGERTC